MRRVDGRSVGAFFTEEFARPLGLGVWLGLPDREHHRAATTLAGPGVLQPQGEDPLRVLTRNPLLAPDATALWHGAASRRGERLAVGAYGTARSMARFYACLARGGELDGVRGRIRTPHGAGAVRSATGHVRACRGGRLAAQRPLDLPDALHEAVRA